MGNSMKMSTMGQISKIVLAANLHLFPIIHNWHFMEQYSDFDDFYYLFDFFNRFFDQTSWF